MGSVPRRMTVDPLADLSPAVTVIHAKRAAVPPQHGVLIGLTGIDGARKGSFTHALVAQLQQQQVKAISLHVDGWLPLPQTRCNPDNLVVHVYTYALRFDALLQHLRLPRKARRTHQVVVDVAEETATTARPYVDLAFWVEYACETALARALQRGQADLPLAKTIHACEPRSFPAQRLHGARDHPRMMADMMLRNDPRLTGESRAATVDARQRTAGERTTAIGLRPPRMPCCRCRPRRRLGVGPRSTDRLQSGATDPERREACRTQGERACRTI